MNSSAANRDLSPERRHDHAERLRTTAEILDSDTDNEAIGPHCESVISGAVHGTGIPARPVKRVDDGPIGDFLRLLEGKTGPNTFGGER